MIKEPRKTVKKPIKRDKGGKFVDGTAPGPGRTQGSLDFNTIFEEAVKKVAGKLNIKPENVDVEVLTKGIALALGGSYNFWKEILERRYGKVKEVLEVSEVIKDEQGIDVDPALKKAIKVYEDELKKQEYRKEDDSKQRLRVDKKEKDKKRKK